MSVFELDSDGGKSCGCAGMPFLPGGLSVGTLDSAYLMRLWEGNVAAAAMFATLRRKDATSLSRPR